MTFCQSGFRKSVMSLRPPQWCRVVQNFVSFVHLNEAVMDSWISSAGGRPSKARRASL